VHKRKRKSREPKGQTRQFNVVVSEDYLDRVGEVADKLRSAGMRVGRVMDLTGTIEGSADSAKEEQLRQIDGVEAVEEQRSYQLPPPESDLQ
jgi:hypothetical protein